MQTDPIWHRDSIGSLKPMQESSRGADHGSDLRLHVSLYAGNCSEHVYTLLIGYRSGGTPGFHTFSGRVTELRAVDEGAVPASAPETCRLFVLPVAARRWVSTDNTFLLYLELLAHFTICFSRNMTMWKILNFFDPKLNYDTNFGIYFLVWRF